MPWPPAWQVREVAWGQPNGGFPLNPARRSLTGTIGYHHVPRSSRFPGSYLPQANAPLEESQSPGVTALSPWGVYRSLRLQLGDPN